VAEGSFANDREKVVVEEGIHIVSHIKET